MRVLVVDQDAEGVAQIERMIGRIQRCSFVHYASPTEARADLPDLIFDLALVSCEPKAASLALIAALRASRLHRQLPVVVLANGAERPETRVDAFEVGATDFLVKPLEPAEFRARMRNLFELRAAQIAIASQTEQLKVEVMSATAKVRAREKEIVLRMCRAVEYHDGETSDHIGRMARYCFLIASELGFERETCEFLHLAAHMHDIGKIGVPSGILRKPGKLTVEERHEMEQHTLFGERILEGSASPLVQLASIVAASHHEKWDGTGYPRRLKGADIPVAGRIAAVADVFDALTSARRYKPGWPPNEARQYLLDNSGQHFDPACVEAFLRRWPEVEAICSGQGDVASAA